MVKRIIECLERVGIIIDEQEEPINIDLNNFIQDSVQFISFILEIEDEFNIEVSEEMLNPESMSTVEIFAEKLKEQVV